MTDSEKVLDLINSAIAAGRRFCDTQVGCSVCPYKKHGVKCLEAFWADHLVKNGVKLPVTCKDCKFFKPIYKGSTNRMCFKHFGLTNAKENDFCSYGERMESNP